MLSKYSIAERISWAAGRQTSRTEDLAYCLLGIFDVNMSLIYGEGSRAFRRLQEEIIKRSNDLTIFAWDNNHDDEANQTLFSPTPSKFCSTIQYPQPNKPEFSLTNKGLRLDNFEGLNKLSLESRGAGAGPPVYTLILGSSLRDEFSLPLKKIGPNLFIRDGWIDIERFDGFLIDRVPYFFSTFHIQVEPEISVSKAFTDLYNANVYIPFHERILIETVLPEMYWDAPSRTFFETSRVGYSPNFALCCKVPMPSDFASEDFSRMASITMWITLGTEGEGAGTTCAIFDAVEEVSVEKWVQRHGGPGHQVAWRGFEEYGRPDFAAFGSSVTLQDGESKAVVSGSVKLESAASSESQARYSLVFNVE